MICFGRSKPEDRKQIRPQNTVCYNSTHMMEKVQSMISVMAILGRNYIRQTTVSRGNAVVEKSPVQHFQVIFTTHLPTPTGSLWRHPFPEPSSTHPLITHFTLKVPSKVAPPLHVHWTGSLWRKMLCLQSQWCIHSFISVRVPS